MKIQSVRTVVWIVWPSVWQFMSNIEPNFVRFYKFNEHWWRRKEWKKEGEI